MAESRCDLCGEQYLVDLPVGHALWDGVIYNRRRNEVANFRAGLPNNPSWYVTAFRKSLEETPWMSPKIRRHKRSDACRMTVVNCLDSVYGHALLKLLNVQRHLERDSGGTVPPQLEMEFVAVLLVERTNGETAQELHPAREGVRPPKTLTGARSRVRALRRTEPPGRRSFIVGRRSSSRTEQRLSDAKPLRTGVESSSVSQPWNRSCRGGTVPPQLEWNSSPFS